MKNSNRAKTSRRLITMAAALASLTSLMCLTGLILLSASSASAQDWPQWRGANRDGKVTGFTEPKAWPKELAKKWSVAAGAGDATPAWVGDKIYVFTRIGDDEAAACLSAADGKEVWRDKYAAVAVTGAAARHPGTRSSPAVGDGKVVTLGAGGVLSCLDAATGKVAWRNEEFKGVPKFFTGMSPIIVDKMVIAQLGGPGAGTIAAFDLATGKIKWKWEGDGPAYGSPVLMTAGGVKQLVAQTDKSLVGVSLADGKLLWQVATPGQRMAFSAATPIVEEQTVIYTGQGTGTKAVKIEKEGEKFAVKDVWSNEETGCSFNTPVLKNGLLFGLSDKGAFFCMDAKAGKTVWTDKETRKDKFGAILDAGSVILALPSNSELIAFKPSDKEYAELARIKVSETATYATPVIAGNRVLVKGQDSLTMYTIE